MRHPLIVLALISLAAACSKQPPLAPSAGTSPKGQTPQPKWAPNVVLSPDATVATIKGVPITAAELDEAIGDDLKTTSQEYVEKVHEMRQQTLESMIIDKLLKTEAEEKGVSVEELVTTEVVEKAQKPSEEELQSAYDRFFKGRSDMPFEEAKDRLAQVLGQEQAAIRGNEYVNELKAKYEVETSLPEPPVQRVEVAATGPSKGAADAPVTIVEFSDFECPFCSRVNPSIDQVMKEYEGKVRVVFRNYPLPMHALAPKAGEAALCADDQGKFWEMHDRLFDHQQELSVAGLKNHAQALGLDQTKFDECLDSDAKAAQVAQDMAEGQAAGVNGTPAFFINGRLLSGAQPFAEFKKLIDSELAAK